MPTRRHESRRDRHTVAADHRHHAAPVVTVAHPDPARRSSPRRHLGNHYRQSQHSTEPRRRIFSTTTHGPLALGGRHDPHERQADTIARQFTRFADQTGPVQRPGNRPTSITPAGRNGTTRTVGGEDTADRIEAQILRMQGGGAPLPAALRDVFETYFGSHLNGVRIHTGSDAAAIAGQLGARALTLGSHIAFGRGEYQPGTQSGRRLLAHELTHVLQQHTGTPCLQRDTARDEEETKEEVWRPKPGDTVVPGPNSVQGHLETLKAVHNNFVQERAQAQATPIGRWDPAYLVVIPERVEYRPGASMRTRGRHPNEHPVLLGGTVHAFRGGKSRRFPVTMRGRGELLPLGIYAKGPDLNRIYEYLGQEGKDPNSYKILTSGFYFDQYIDHDWLAARQQEGKWLSPGDAAQLRAFFSKYTILYLLVGHTNEDRKQTTVEETKPKAAPWIRRQVRRLKKNLASEKAQDPTAIHPDKLRPVVKKNAGLWQWELQVRVDFDTRDKEKEYVYIPLRRRESGAQLKQRAKRAAEKAHIKRARRLAKKAEKQAPRWARKLKDQLWRKLKRLRKKEPKADDFPDQLSLDLRTPQAPSVDEVYDRRDQLDREPEPETVDLQVWVDKQFGKKFERVGGSLPFPLAEGMQADDLIAPVREATAALRDKKKIRVTDLSRKAGKAKYRGGKEGGTATHMAYRSEIVPLDLMPTDITVTGARNKFRMDLDYTSVHGEDLMSLWVAMMRTVYFVWEIYDASELPGAPKAREASWPRRATRLRRLVAEQPGLLYQQDPVYSPRLQKLAEAKHIRDHSLLHIGAGQANLYFSGAGRIGMVPPDMAKLVDDKRLDDPRYVLNLDDIPDVEIVKELRVRFPDQPGDYLVFCEATPKANKDTGDIWASSRAVYPVHTKAALTVGKQKLLESEDFLESIDKAIARLESKLSDPAAKLSEEQRESLEREKRILVKEYDYMLANRSRTLPQAMTTDIERAEQILADLDRLEKLLPGVVKQAKQDESNPKPSSLLPADLQDTYFLLLRERKTLEGKRKDLKIQLSMLRDVRSRAKGFKKQFNAASPYQYRPEVVFVSQISGQLYAMVMMLGEAPERRHRLHAMSTEGVTYSLVDLTSKQTQNIYYGTSTKDRSRPEAHAEAIDQTFRRFGEQAEYGSGLIVARVPQPVQVPSKGKDRERRYRPGLHPGKGFREYRSKKGWSQKALEWLGYIAMAAGAAALVATGVGAPAAAALLGAVAATAGAAVALHNIADRARRNTLEWDAELALDVISLISVMPSMQGVRIAAQTRSLGQIGARSASWYQGYRQTKHFLEIYGAFEMGATLILVPAKLAQDVYRVYNDPSFRHLSHEEKDRLVHQAVLEAAQTGLMMLGGAVAARRAGRKPQPISKKQKAELQRQAELMELEGLNQYESMTERGWLDDQGRLTDFGAAQVETIAPGASRRAAALPPPDAPDRPAQSGVRDSLPEPVAPGSNDPQDRPPARRRKPASEAAGPQQPRVPDDGGKRTTADDTVTRETELPGYVEQWRLPDATVFKLAKPARITADYVHEVRRVYQKTWQEEPSREVGLYRNTETGEFIIVIGDDRNVFVEIKGGRKQAPQGAGKKQRWKKDLQEETDVGEWQGVAHSHPVDPRTGYVSDLNRLPTGVDGDLGMLLLESARAGGTARVSRIYFMTPAGPDFTTIGYRPGADPAYWIEYPDALSGIRKTLRFKDLTAFHRWLRTTHGIAIGVPRVMRRLEKRLARRARRRARGTPRPRRGTAPDNQPPGSATGRVERSAAAAENRDPNRYQARESFGDVNAFGDEQARYYAAAEFENGTVEMDFVLVRDEFPGARSQMRGRQEFENALDYFREIHGENSVERIAGDWGGGNNLQRFNDRYHYYLTRGMGRQQAMQRAALDTHTGRWSAAEGYSRVEIVSETPSADGLSFAQVSVLFHRAGTAHPPAAPAAHPPASGEGQRHPRRDPGHEAQHPGRRRPTNVHVRARFSLASDRVYRYDNRDIVVVHTSRGRRAFYRRTGEGDQGRQYAYGAQPGDWVPFDGFQPEAGGAHMIKHPYDGEGHLRRWGTEENRQIGQWLKRQDIRAGDDVGEAWGTVQAHLERSGVRVTLLLGGPEARRPAGPPPSPPSGAGGGGRAGGGPVRHARPLDPVERDFLRKAGPIWWARSGYEPSIVFNHDLFRARWRRAAGAGEPLPEHGFVDHHQREFVIYDAPQPTRRSPAGNPPAPRDSPRPTRQRNDERQPASPAPATPVARGQRRARAALEMEQNDLPRPLPPKVSGFLEFGTRIIRWRSGEDGARTRLREILADPHAALNEFIGKGVTPDIAIKWRHYYEREVEITHATNNVQLNRTARARADLMREIYLLLRFGPRTKPKAGVFARIAERLRGRGKANTEQQPRTESVTEEAPESIVYHLRSARRRRQSELHVVMEPNLYWIRERSGSGSEFQVRARVERQADYLGGGELVIDMTTRSTRGESAEFLLMEDQYRAVFEYFSPRFEGIRVSWSAANIDEFRALHNRQPDPRQAALQTTIGQLAAQAGFGRVIVRTLEPVDAAPGAHQKVVVTFAR